MAQLTITIPDAAVTRVRAAFGHPTSVSDPTWIPGTVADVQDALLAYLRRYVRNYEEQQAVVQARSGVTDAV